MKKITGIWHYDLAGKALGTLLILLEELQIQRQIHSAVAVDVVVMGNIQQLINDIPMKYDGASNDPCCSGAQIAKLSLMGIRRPHPLLAVLRSMTNIADIFVCAFDGDNCHIESQIEADTILWPDLQMLQGGTHNYDSTQFIQNYHAQHGSVPYLSVTDDLLGRARDFLFANAKGRLPIAVHLKHNPNITGQSNANVAAWLAFFSDCQDAYPIHFVLIGNDETNARFRSLPNVTIASDHDIYLDGYLALIQASPLFMGMMSGPANMALFGEHPYLVFKNPDHHADEMRAELGEDDRYPFASLHQRVLREWDTLNNLHAAFDDLYRKIAA